MYNVGRGHYQTLRTIEFESGSGAVVRDAEGREYVDFYTNHSAPLGHDMETVRRAVTDAHPVNIGLYGNTARRRLAETLARLVPGYTSFQFCTSGAMANETALRYAMAITGRTGFAGSTGSMLGRTTALTALGKPDGQEPGQHFAALGYPPEDGRPFPPVEEVAALIDEQGAERLAALFVEPILSKFAVAPPPGWLRTLKEEVLDPRGILLVTDETVVAGRVGAWRASATQDVAPDVITISKCFSSGFPFSAVACLERHAEATLAVKGGETSGGQSLQCAVALHTIEAIERGGLLDHVVELERSFLRSTADLPGWGGVVDARAVGALCALELYDRDAAAEAGRRCLDEGVLVAVVRSTIRITPPLNIGLATFEEGLVRVRRGLGAPVPAEPERATP